VLRRRSTPTAPLRDFRVILRDTLIIFDAEPDVAAVPPPMPLMRDAAPPRHKDDAPCLAAADLTPPPRTPAASACLPRSTRATFIELPHEYAPFRRSHALPMMLPPPPLLLISATPPPRRRRFAAAAMITPLIFTPLRRCRRCADYCYAPFRRCLSMPSAAPQRLRRRAADAAACR